MSYSWRLWESLRDATTGGKSVDRLVSCIATDVKAYPREAFKMNFIDNHDKNSWDGTPYSIFGDGLEAAIVFTCTVNGMPLVYSGQEAGHNKSLSFFEKDCIKWENHRYYDIYKTMFSLKKRNQALWNGKWGGEMIRLANNHPDKVISFIREKNGDRIIAIFNFSNDPVKVVLDLNYYCGKYLDLFQGCEFHTHNYNMFRLDAWGYKVLEWDVSK
jgi:cyclomaltodextrinase / maltogenic alpha-amylase / neopullulanase